MTAREGIAFVKANGLVLESALGPVPNLAAAVAEGEGPTRGSWWSHPKRCEIFRCTRAVRDSGEVLVCRLLDGEVTYIHRRSWLELAG